MGILITEDAFTTVANAVREGRLRGVELGGSLLAHERGDDILVAYALPTGPHAEQGPARVKTDAAFQNTALAQVQARVPGLVYMGDWHVHPMNLPELSSIDRRTARDILLGDAAHRERLLLMLGTGAAQREPIVMAFIARLKSSGALRVDEVPLRRVARDYAEVVSRLGRALTPLDELLARGPEHLDAVEHDAADRIEGDLREIRVELSAEAHLWMSDDILGATIRRGEREAVVLFPPEYPRGAPQVFAGSLDRGPLNPVRLPYAWSSLHHLIDPISDALESAASRPPPPPSLLRRVLGVVLAPRIRRLHHVARVDRDRHAPPSPQVEEEVSS